VGCTETGKADAYFSRLNCTFARSCLQFKIEGKFDFLDGIVGMNSCDHMRRLYDIWQQKIGSPYMHFLSVPHEINDRALNWYYDEIVGFKDSIEKSYNVQISGKLKNAIELYNETRRLLKKLYEFQKNDPLKLTGSDFMNVILAGMTTPKDLYNQLLSELIKDTEKQEGIPGHKIRLMIVGSAFDDLVTIKTIEDLGAVVVADALCFGKRYIMEPIATNGNLLMNLAKSYLNRPSCARMIGYNQERWQFIEKMVREFRVDGIIYQNLRYCDLGGGERFYIQKQASDRNIPMLILEREYWASGLEQVKTRVGALLEMIEAK
jgi:benzoyl-CoA reductase/2-hydroxyglutaryl-CoA dehydratase subunit BcrC/BadD/HgdB